MMENVPEGDIRLNFPEKINSCFVDSYESPVMKLSQPEKAENADSPGVKFINTTDPNDKSNLGLRSNMNLPIKFGISVCIDLGSVSLLILLFILLDPLQQFLPFGFVGGSPLLSEFFERSSDFLVSLLLLLESFRFGGNFLVGHKLKYY